MGVFLWRTYTIIYDSGLPHARGGVSRTFTFVDASHPSSPRPWGCFEEAVYASYGAPVFPTPVGVFLAVSCGSLCIFRLPHARGGVSLMRHVLSVVLSSSPRPWGCFCFSFALNIIRCVFPTPVGVFLKAAKSETFIFCLPHARGGVSGSLAPRPPRLESSPRPWGCFLSQSAISFCISVFPTPVGVFPS
ncbi:conserved hypothetical protein [methanotrophic bacterial endosymbiont of Bathymodiolus sp.]|nr:conserved hypothetical protein [methanotrophic bacterial endosymbiont of Bathymodiolus sp.]